jgi:hypothetical protein
MKMLDDISHQLEDFPRKPLQGLTQQNAISVDNVWTANKLCIFVHIKLLLFPKLNIWIMEKE